MRLPDIGYPQTGDKAEKGNYACVNCPHDSENDKSLIFLQENEKLPKCPVCGQTHWMKF